MSENLLIIFVKNLEEGKVKTRLAKSIGSKSALKVYEKLLLTTQNISQKVAVDRNIYFSNKVDYNFWKSDFKTVQKGIDLGERMQDAFTNGFNQGYKKIVLIGTDLPELSEKIIEDAFQYLDKEEVVFGPSEDGGYYLIGLTSLYKCLFTNKPWSTPELLKSTLQELKEKNINASLMQTLNDIDTFDDLKQYPDYLKLVTQ